jgi:hypothetical protein
VNNSKRFWFYFAAISFPVFFVLHAVNEQFGLIRISTISGLLLYYVLVCLAVALFSKLTLKRYERATVFMFVVLCIFFFFGAIKDATKDTWLHAVTGHYKISVPLVFIIFLILFFIIKKSASDLIRGALFIRTLLIICVLVEAAFLFYNLFSGKARQKDLGDIDHSLIKNITIPDSVRKPDIFWIVMDEYSGKGPLEKRWKFKNPLDSVLASKGFFTAADARSPYNYTHYSLTATLDMQYLKELKEHSEIGFRDIVRGNISLEETNVLKVLKQMDYNIYNYTIYNINDHPTKAHQYFIGADFKLVDNQTLAGRIRQDIGWNFIKDDHMKGLRNEYKYRQSLMEEGVRKAQETSAAKDPSFFMFHFMLTHEPFLYNNDGSLDTTAGFGMAPEKYVPSIRYANNVLIPFVDSLKRIYAGRDLVIIIQGDHGYKFNEQDPLFDQEGCSILYAVYCSDSNYTGWKQSFNSINSFQVLFNKYFHTNLPIQENRSFNLFYR